MDNTQLLQTLGLTDKEAQIYNLLLEVGKVQASVLIAKTGLKRATVYKSLYSLKAKGLVKHEDIRKKLHFAPLAPDSLLKLSDQQFQLQERARDDLRSLIPTLTSQFILSVEKPIVTTFEGVEGLKKIYEDTLKVNKPIDGVVQVSNIHPQVHAWLKSVYAKKRTKQGISARVIVSSGKWMDEYRNLDKTEARETISVDSQVFPFEHEVDIYGDKVAFINFKEGEPLIGIIIHHPLIAKTMRAMFELAWIGAQKVNEQKPAAPLPSS